MTKNLLNTLCMLVVALFLATACGGGEKKSETGNDDGASAAPADTTQAEKPAAAQQKPAQSLHDLGAGNPGFTTLMGLLEAAGMENALKDDPITVFAPTNDAFAQLDPSTISALQKPENKEKLKALLEYHFLDYKISLDTLKDGTQLQTRQGSMITVKVGKYNGNPAVYFNDDVLFITPNDPDVSNGIALIISKPLSLPE